VGGGGCVNPIFEIETFILQKNMYNR
jgi:hypothetical protein